MTVTETAPVRNALGLEAIDHLEWWVGNARAFAAFLSSAFGFAITAWAGPETGCPDRLSYVLEQGAVRFVVTSALDPASPIAEHVRVHGDGVRDVAFTVADATAAYAAAVARGATGVAAVAAASDGQGRLLSAAVASYGDTRHTFIERRHYRGRFAPGYEAPELVAPCGPVVGLDDIDHVVANVELGALDGWVDFYRRVLGFEQLVHFDDDTISTE